MSLPTLNDINAAYSELRRLRYRIQLADACILWLTAGPEADTARGLELARAYMHDYGDHPDNAAIDSEVPK